MSTIEHRMLVKTRNRLSDHDNWCNYNSLGIGSNGSVCLGVALTQAYNELSEEEKRYDPTKVINTTDVLVILHKAIFGVDARNECDRRVNIVKWNDTEATHESLMNVLDRAVMETAPKETEKEVEYAHVS